MNNSKIEWMTYARADSAAGGKFSAVDNKGDTLIFEWKRNGILSHEIAAFKKNLSDLAAEKISHSELAFLKAHPDAVSTELFLSSCKPLLSKGVENADWNAIQETIKTTVKQFYHADLSKFGPDAIKPLLDDLYFCATVRRSDEKESMGFLLFSVTPALPFGDVKVINFFFSEDSLSNLQKVFMGLIFKIIPNTKRIFLFARPTDAAALNEYKAMGFEIDENPFQDPSHKVNHLYQTTLDYKVDKSNLLQGALEILKITQEAE